jgi:hypothetical protein
MGFAHGPVRYLSALKSNAQGHSQCTQEEPAVTMAGMCLGGVGDSRDERTKIKGILVSI